MVVALRCNTRRYFLRWPSKIGSRLQNPDPSPDRDQEWRLTPRCSGPHPGVRPGSAAELRHR